MQKMNPNPRMTNALVSSQLLKSNAITVVDVGMRAGAQSHWKNYGKSVHVIGFEPDEAECHRLNETTPEHNQTCYP